MAKCKKESEDPYKSVRRSIPPPGHTHKVKTKYTRKIKHKRGTRS